MKRLIMACITVLLVVLFIIEISKGISIFGIKILSISQINEQNKQLKAKQMETSNLSTTEYKNNLDSLETTEKKLEETKSGYYDMASTSSDEELEQANVIQTYSREFLWAKIGTHATQKNLNLNLDISPAENSDRSVITFEVTGKYNDISDFILSIEQDKSLAFRIQDFKLTDFKINPDNKDEEYTENLLKATFKVENVKVKEETTTKTIEEVQKEHEPQSVDLNVTTQEQNTVDQNTQVQN